MKITRQRALALLAKCTGDEIWSVDVCRASGVPQTWIDELVDTYESGFNSDDQTIYVEDSVTNQYHGLRDLDVAVRVGQSIGLDVARLTAASLSRRGIVQSIKDAVMEGD